MAKGNNRHIGKATVLSVWALRLVIGGVFILSGITKMIDLWGFIFKIEQYLSVWDMSVPRSLILVGAMGLSTYEFLFGAMLATGSFKRISPFLLLLSMFVMLPLTGYIALYNPVDDCGCFGEYLKLSNNATFVKNILITAALIYLCRYNIKVNSCIFKPAAQWAPALFSFIYIIVIGLIGYTIQPLADFRQFPVGSRLIAGSDENIAEPVFVYEKDGVTRDFAIDELPDSSWTYVDRKDNSISEKSFVVYTPDGEDDVTEDVIGVDGDQLVLVIPEPSRADISYTYTINELQQIISGHGGSMIALLATGKEGIDRWLDMSMAAYECYSVEDTQLKELSRGVMSLVYLRDGVIKWKRTVASIDMGTIDRLKNDSDNFDSLDFNSHEWFLKLTAAYVASLLLILIIQLAVDKLNAKNNAKPEKTP